MSIRRRDNSGSGFARFLTLSLAVHALIIGAGITGGAAYVRRGGVEAPAATIVFDTMPEPSVTNSTVAPPAEPERSVENLDAVTEPSESPLSSEGELAETSAAEFSAGAAESSAVEATPSRAATVLDRAIGDPRASWRLPSRAAPGLQLGLAKEPPISDCCGEPQPAPKVAIGNDAYVYPQVLKMARAEFPVSSQRMRERGSVLLEMTVGADGLVKDVRVAQSSGHSRLDDCAVAAAWDWLFKPATRNGVAEVSLARHRYSFRLTGSGG